MNEPSPSPPREPSDINRDYIEAAPGVHIHRSQDAAATLARLFPAATFPDHPANQPGFTVRRA